MRTTITLDPDAEALIRKSMRERGLSFKQAVNEAIRAGLAPRKTREGYRTPTFDLGVASVPGHKFLQLAGELEDQEIVRNMRMGK
jgi:hypothetical protein